MVHVLYIYRKGQLGLLEEDIPCHVLLAEWEGNFRRSLGQIFASSEVQPYHVDTPLVLWKFKRSLDKESADYLNSITGGVDLHKFPAEVNKILDYIAEYTSLLAKSDPLQEECELTHVDLLAAEPDPSFPISSDSAVEPSPEPGTSKGEEIHSPKFSMRFEDESLGNIETLPIS